MQDIHLHPYFKQAVVILIIVTVALVVAKIVSNLIKNAMAKSAELLNVDQTKYTFLRHLATTIIYFLAIVVIIYSIPSLRSFSVSLFASAGIFAAFIGLASQQAFSNIINGIFIVTSKPFKVNDRIELNNPPLSGMVEDITLRHTVLRDFQNRRIVIPNSVMGAQIIINANLYDEKIRRQIDFSVDYDTNIDHAIAVIIEECLKHPLCIDNRTPEQKEQNLPIVDVRLVEFGASELRIRAFAWAANPADAFALHTELNIAVKKRFDQEGIVIPFPQTVISYRDGKK
ncbi:MAG: mechanosensitive ion channel family protein [Flavobacteriales bacterium]